MSARIFKVHTDIFGRLVACIRHAMYGISVSAFRNQMPRELADVAAGDIVFISEKEVSDNALFGPFYVVGERPPVVAKDQKGAWIEVDTMKTPAKEIAYWVEIEKRYWCLLFDLTLAERISIVWPNDWSKVKVNLPSWGLVTGEDAKKLIDFAARNEVKAHEFLRLHEVW